MTAYIPRHSWQSAEQPVAGPARRQPFRQGIIHYEGVTRDYVPADIGQHLLNMQAAYINSRHYSLGYGFACVSDPDHPNDGTLWEIRGFDLNMASNPGAKWNNLGRLPAGNVNDWTGSVLLIGRTGAHASPRAAAAVRGLFAEWHDAAGTMYRQPWPHSEVDWTSCCGDQYRADITAGLFNPTREEGPPDMLTYIITPPAERPGAPWFYVHDGNVRYCTSYDAGAHAGYTPPPFWQAGVEQYDYMRKSLGI